MAADLAVDGAGVQAGAAANAAEGFAIFGIGEDFGSAVVEQDEMEFLGPVFFAGSAGAAENAGVDGHPLAGGTSGQKLEHDGQIGQARNELFNSDQTDENARGGDGLPGVALVFDDADLACFGDEEISTGDAEIGGAKFVAQEGPRLGREGGRIIVVGSFEIFAEQAGDRGAVLVNDRGDQVAGLVVADLDDELAEIGLDEIEAGGFEKMSQFDFLAGHGFAFDDARAAGGFWRCRR